MYLDGEKLHKDIFIKLSKDKKSQKWLYKNIGLSQGCLWRLQFAKEMRLTIYISLVEWLGKEINEYLKC